MAAPQGGQEAFLAQLDQTWAQMRANAEKLATAEEEKQQARALLDQATGEIEQLAMREQQAAARVSELQSQVESLSFQLHEANTRNTEATDKVKKLEQQVNELSASRGSLTDANADLEAQLTKMKSRAEKSHEHSAKARKEAENIHRQYKEARRELDKVKQRLEAQEATSQSGLQRAEQEKAELNKHMFNLMEELREAERKKATAEKTIEEVKRTLAESNADRASVGTELAQCQKRLAQFEEEYAAQSETIVRLRGIEASVESERALWEDKLSAAQAGRMEALQRVERMEQELRAGKQGVADERRTLATEMNALRSEVESLRQKAAQAAEQRKEASEQLEELQYLREQAKANGSLMEEKETELDRLVGKLRDIERERDQLSERLKAQDTRAGAKVKEHEQTIREQRQQVRDVEDENRKLVEKYDEQADQLQQAKAQLEHAREELKGVADSTQARCSALADKVSTLQRELDDAIATRSAAELALRKGAAEARENEKRLADAAKNEILNLQQQTGSVHTRLQEKEQEINQLHEELTAAKSAAQQWEVAHNTVQETLSMTTDELQEHKKRVQLAEGSVKQLEKRLAALTKEEQTLQETLSETEKKLIATQEAAASSSAECDDLRAQLTQAEQRVENLAQELQALHAHTEHNILDFGHQSEALQVQMEQMESDLAEARAKATKASQETAKVRKECEDMMHKLRDAEERESMANAAAAAARRDLLAVRDSAMEDSEKLQRFKADIERQAKAALDEAKSAHEEIDEHKRKISQLKDALTVAQRKAKKLERDNDMFRRLQKLHNITGAAGSVAGTSVAGGMPSTRAHSESQFSSGRSQAPPSHVGPYTSGAHTSSAMSVYSQRSGGPASNRLQLAGSSAMSEGGYDRHGSPRRDGEGVYPMNGIDEEPHDRMSLLQVPTMSGSPTTATSALRGGGGARGGRHGSSVPSLPAPGGRPGSTHSTPNNFSHRDGDVRLRTSQSLGNGVRASDTGSGSDEPAVSPTHPTVTRAGENPAVAAWFNSSSNYAHLQGGQGRGTGSADDASKLSLPKLQASSQGVRKSQQAMQYTEQMRASMQWRSGDKASGHHSHTSSDERHSPIATSSISSPNRRGQPQQARGQKQKQWDENDGSGDGDVDDDGGDYAQDMSVADDLIQRTAHLLQRRQQQLYGPDSEDEDDGGRAAHERGALDLMDSARSSGQQHSDSPPRRVVHNAAHEGGVTSSRDMARHAQAAADVFMASSTATSDRPGGMGMLPGGLSETPRSSRQSSSGRGKRGTSTKTSKSRKDGTSTSTTSSKRKPKAGSSKASSYRGSSTKGGSSSVGPAGKVKR